MKHIGRHLLSAAFAAALLLSAGCGEKSDAQQNPAGTMTIVSNPQGATVTILRKNIGVTPRTTKPVPPQFDK